MNWIRQLVSRRQLTRDLSDEISQHIDEKTDELVQRGMPREEARRAARREFGNVTLLEERGREVWRWTIVEDLISDTRYGFRQLRKSPAFAAAAVLTLALGIGANTAVFSVVNAVILRPLPFPEPHRLVSVQSRYTRGAPSPTELSYPTFFDFRAYNRVFEHIVSYRGTRFTLSAVGEPVYLPGEIVSWDLFPLLRVQLALGRGFLPDEEKAGHRVVVLSDRLWKGTFKGDPSIVGRSITLDSNPYLVIGVAPPGFNFPVKNRKVQLWTTLERDASSATVQPITEQRGARLLEVIARLKPGVSIEQAHAQIDTVAAALAKQYPDENQNVASTYVRSELDQLTGDTRGPLLVLLGAVGLVLLIACANIANLLLARTSEREREFAMRAAIGATRGAIIRQLLTESAALAIIGCAAGVLVAYVCVNFMLPLAGDSIPRIDQANVDTRVLSFSVALSLLTSLLFSLAPALRLAKAELTSPLKEASRNSVHGHDRLRNWLVVAQVTIGLVLLSAAALLGASFLHLLRRDPGFRPDHLLSFQVGVPDQRYPDDKQVQFNEALYERLRNLPGIVSVGGALPLPWTGNQINVSFNIEERPSSPSSRPASDMAYVTPDFFRTVGIPLLQGRWFTDRDDSKAPPVLIVNRAFADKFFPGEDVVGKRIEPGATSSAGGSMLRAIVGVVGNARQSALSVSAEPIYYFPYKQLPWGVPPIVVRTSMPPTTLEPAIRAAIASIDAYVPMYEAKPMDDILLEGIARPRFQMLLLTSFAGIALFLTVVGLYGVLSYSVLQRTREIGLRVALGASREMVLGMVLTQGLRLVGLGVVLGLAGSLGGTHLLGRMIYGVSPRNPLLLASACIAIALTAALAAYLPARRAASIDPMQALRNE